MNVAGKTKLLKMTRKNAFYSFIRGTFHLKIDGGLEHIWVADVSQAGSRNAPGSKAPVLSVLYRIGTVCTGSCL